MIDGNTVEDVVLAFARSLPLVEQPLDILAPSNLFVRHTHAHADFGVDIGYCLSWSHFDFQIVLWSGVVDIS